MVVSMNIEEIKKDLSGILNKHSLENETNTPDFILAEYLLNCLLAFNSSFKQRTEWYSKTTPTTGNKEDTTEGTLKAMKVILDSMPGTSLAEKYQKAGGVPVKTRYADEIKQREQQ